MATWSKKAAIERMTHNPLLQEVLQKEPRIQSVIEEAVHQKNVPGYHRIHTYYALKRQVEQLVGWYSQQLELRTQQYYDVVIQTIDDLLPPDAVDREL